MNLDKKFLVWGLSYAAAGMVLGIYMAASHNHGELVTHAHILLVGFVLSLVYGLIHRLWLTRPKRRVASFQFAVHQAAALVLSVGLFLLYGNLLPADKLDPILGAGAAGVLLGLLLMLYMVVSSGTASVAQAG
jgi:hypothetical protein